MIQETIHFGVTMSTVVIHRIALGTMLLLGGLLQLWLLAMRADSALSWAGIRWYGFRKMWGPTKTILKDPSVLIVLGMSAMFWIGVYVFFHT